VTPHDTERRGEPKAPAQKLGGEEGLEDAGPGFLVHTGPGVGHIDADIVSGGDREALGPGPLAPLGEVLGPDPDRERARVIPDGFPAVDDKVHHQLLELSPVGLHQGAIVWHVDDESDLLRDRSANEGTHFSHQLRQVHRQDDEPALPGVCQELSGQVGRPLAGR
jgi:hypothetical protein